MSRLQVGEKIPDFTFDTPFESGLSYRHIASLHRHTALVFLRYYGCTLCQLDIHDYAASYDLIRNQDAQLLVVLQSDPKALAEQLKMPDALPFRLICDPQKKLYAQFDIMPAESREKMFSPDVLVKIARAKREGYSHGKYEGDELQLPAAFITDAEGMIAYAHYASKVADVPSAADLARLMQ